MKQFQPMKKLLVFSAVASSAVLLPGCAEDPMANHPTPHHHHHHHHHETVTTTEETTVTRNGPATTTTTVRTY